MKVVVAGGSGFIGRALVARLLSEGHEAGVLTRSAARARGTVPERVELVEWDARSEGAWERTVDGANAVINLVGEPLPAKRWSREQKERLRASRVDSTAALVRACEKAAARPTVLVNASAVGYYGPHGDEPLGEDAPPGGDFVAELTRQWEETAQGAESFGVRVVRLRTGVVLGEGGGMLAKMLPPFRMFVGGPLGNGRQWLSWIHQDDIVGLYLLALENEAVRGPINGTAPEPVRMAEFCRTLGRVLGRPSWAAVPAPVLRLLVGELADLLLTGQRVEPREALRLGYSFRFPALEPALRDLLGK